MGYTLGVDLGTTWTAAAAFGPDGVDVVSLGARGPALPSVIARDNDEFAFGEQAERRLVVDPGSGARECKRRLGDPTPFVLSAAPYSADTLLGKLLGHVLARAEEQRGEPPVEVVLTHPATYGEYKLDLLREAARTAGLADVRLLSEPQAAAVHYARIGKIAPGDTVAVYDFGGGTFDAAVVRYLDDEFELVGTPEGIERLGGVDLDQAVLAHVDAALDGALRALDATDQAVRQALVHLREECTTVKETLSDDTEATVNVALPGLSTQVRLTRAEFEAMVRPRIGDTVEALRRAVTSAGLTFQDLASVLLVGGSSRIPAVTELVGQETGRPVALDVNPKLVVAMGAAQWVVAAGAPVGAEAVGADAGAEIDTTDTGTDKVSDQQEQPDAKDSKEAKEAKEAKPRRSRQGVAKAAAGAAVAAGVVAGGAAAASALTEDGGANDDEFRTQATAHALDRDLLDGGDDAADDDGAPQASRPAAASSLDVFDEVTAPTGRAAGGGGAAPARGAAQTTQRRPPPSRQRDDDDDGPAPLRSAGASRTAPSGPAPTVPSTDAPPPAGSTAPTAPEQDAPAAPTPPVSSAGEPAPDAPPAPQAPPPPGDAVEAVRAQLRERLEAWKPPKFAEQEDVADLRGDLDGLIERFQPLPGQSLENAAAALQADIDNRVKLFVLEEQNEELLKDDAQEDRAEAAQKQRQAENAEAQKGLEAYGDALERYVDQYQPDYPFWIAKRGGLLDLEGQKEALHKLINERDRFDPSSPRSLREQQLDLETRVKEVLQKWRDDQYEANYNQAKADYDRQIRPRQDVLNNNQPPLSQKQRDALEAEIDDLEGRKGEIESRWLASRSKPLAPPEVEGELDSHLEPEPPPMVVTQMPDALGKEFVLAGAAEAEDEPMVVTQVGGAKEYALAGAAEAAGETSDRGFISAVDDDVLGIAAAGMVVTAATTAATQTFARADDQTPAPPGSVPPAAPEPDDDMAPLDAFAAPDPLAPAAMVDDDVLSGAPAAAALDEFDAVPDADQDDVPGL